MSVLETIVSPIPSHSTVKHETEKDTAGCRALNRNYIVGGVVLKTNRRRKASSIPGMKSGRCPYCGSSITLRSAEGIYRENSAGKKLFVCSRYPECDAYVRVIPGTSTPIGSMANGDLRALRREAHRHFDMLHQTGLMSRSEAYNWLAAMLQSPMSQAHIGYLGEYYCRQVIEESKSMLENRRRTLAGWPGQLTRRAAGGELYAVK
jgi:hypothetical protein